MGCAMGQLGRTQEELPPLGRTNAPELSILGGVKNRRPTLTVRSKAGMYLWTVLGTLGCVVAALYIDSFNFMNLSLVERNRAIVFDVLVPLLLAAPLFLLFTGKLLELERAQRKLAILASTDSLTECLNRGAFTMLVDAYLHEVAAKMTPRSGALLVVDADNFKSINDSFGHIHGDEALVLIASTIKKVLRGTDLIGRIGGEEFGIFLPHASPALASSTAECIRNSIASAEFRPGGEMRPLSVSVGGAAFEAEVPFSELFRVADQRLYAAKQNGRNRVEVAPMPPEGREATLH